MDDTPTTYPPELRTLLERAHAGDGTCLADLRQAFRDHPELAATFGDLCQHAEMSLVQLAAGPSLVAREAIHQELAVLRDKLNTTSASELERLLVGRICLNHLELNYLTVDHATRIRNNVDPRSIAASAKHLGSTHTRFLAAVRTLANIHKARPGKTILDVFDPDAVGCRVA